MAEGLVPESVSRRISALRWPASLVVVLAHAMQSFLFAGDYPDFSGRIVLNLDSPRRWMYAVVFYSGGTVGDAVKTQDRGDEAGGAVGK